MENKRFLWLILLGLALVVCVCCAAAAGVAVWSGWNLSNTIGGSGPIAVVAQEVQTLPTQGPIILNVNVPVGDVVVRAGSEPQVKVEATRRAWGISRARAQEVLDGITIQVRQTGDQVWVEATGLSATGRPGQSPRADLVVTVPRQTSLNLDVKVGRVTASGVHGDVWVRTDVGQATLTDVAPVEQLDVRTRVGNVELAGPLTPAASYEIVSDVGRIAVWLPADSSFSINARSDIGDVEMGFTLSGISAREGFVSKEVRGEVGPSPTTSLNLRSRVCAISVRPAR